MPKDKPEEYLKKPKKKKEQEPTWTKKFFKKIQKGGTAGRQTQKVLDELNKRGY